MLCCGDVGTKLWEKEFETPGNAEPGWQPGLLLDFQDDGGEVPYTQIREWPFFVCWLCGQFKNPGLYHIQRRFFEDFSIGFLRISLSRIFLFAVCYFLLETVSTPNSRGARDPS